MSRAYTVVALLLTLPFVCGADEPSKPAAAAGTAAAHQVLAPTETVIRMAVQSMAAPIPALKYQLLPELSEMNPGNPIQGYLRCFMEEHTFFYGKECVEDRERWSEMPLRDLPVEAVFQQYSFHPLTDADYAARLDTPDWQALLRIKREGVNLVVPDLQSMRLLAMSLRVRFRAEVASRQFDKALVTAKTMFAMSRHLCEHPTFVGDLVGFATLDAAVGPLEEMIQQPGCPNFYWALSALPSPLVSIYKGMQGDRTIFINEFASLSKNAPMTDRELQKLVDRLDELIGLTPGDTSTKRGDIRGSLVAKSKDEKRLAAARVRLASAGLDPKHLKQFPPLQVVLLDEVLAFLERGDDDAKAMMLPFWQMESVLAANRRTREKDTDRGSLSPLLFSVVGVRKAQVRLEQRLALLRCVEALRLYGADHDGRLPGQLNDVPVPVSVDPVTGQSFGYRLDGARAVIRGAPVPREKGDTRHDTNVYEVTLEK